MIILSFKTYYLIVSQLMGNKIMKGKNKTGVQDNFKNPFIFKLHGKICLNVNIILENYSKINPSFHVIETFILVLLFYIDAYGIEIAKNNIFWRNQEFKILQRH